jgi:hypothetical protein
VSFISASIKHEANTGTVFPPQGCIYNFPSVLGFDTIKMKLDPWFEPDKGDCQTENLIAPQNRDLNEVRCIPIPGVSYLLSSP